MTQIINPVAFQAFHSRARSIYDGMKARAKKDHLRLEFDIHMFEAWLLGRFKGGPEGSVRCEYSGQVLSAETFFIDHKIPVSRGGMFWLSNLAVCSEKENLRKGNMTAGEYMRLKVFVRQFAPVVEESIWNRLQVGDVQRFGHFRKKRKAASH